MHVKEGLDCAALALRNDVVESLWVRIGRKANVDVVVGAYYRSPSPSDDTDVLFYKELREISRSIALVLMDNFSFPGFNWDYHTADTNRSRKFQKHEITFLCFI